ncbi:MAG: SIMPL domain-containing protein [Anaerolineae bacterium]
MRRHLASIAVTGALVAVVAAAAIALPDRIAPVAAQGTDGGTSGSVRYITVVGQGVVSVTPDIAVLNVGAETIDADIQKAIETNNQTMDDVVAALADAGIEDADVQTSNFSIYRDQGYGPMEAAATEPQYHVSNMVIVTIRDLETVGDILDAVVAAGANSIYGVNFTLEDWTQAQSDARVEAMSDAADRASQLADLAGVELGEILSVSEVIGGQSVPMAALSSSMGFGGGASVSPGQLDVTTSVQVSYAVQ